jgi:hypothetical protein
VIKIAGRALAALFVLISMAGTTASGLVLGEAFVADTKAWPYAPGPGLCLVMMAIAVESLRLALSINGERVWRGSRFQGVTFALPLWLACTVYAIVVPLLAVIVAVPPSAGVTRALAALIVAWVIVQLVAGLLPGIRWPAASKEEAPRALHPASNAQPPPARAPAVCASTPDDLFTVIAGLAELPEGSSLPGRGRITADGEIVMSQSGLSGLIGRPKPTVRRWLHELERSGRITCSANGKTTSIRVASPNAPAPNGHAGA